MAKKKRIIRKKPTKSLDEIFDAVDIGFRHFNHRVDNLATTLESFSRILENVFRGSGLDAVGKMERHLPVIARQLDGILAQMDVVAARMQSLADSPIAADLVNTQEQILQLRRPMIEIQRTLRRNGKL